jgi:O-antigen ligase
MTPGTILFLAGAGTLGLAVVLNLILVFTAGSSKRKINARMKEKY